MTRLPTDPEIPESQKELAELLRSVAEKPPYNTHVDSGPWDFLLRLESSVQEARVRPLMHEMLADANAAVRDRALGMLMGLPANATTFDRLIEVVDKHRKLLAAEVNGRTLAQRMQHALSNLAQGAAQRRRAAKAMVALSAGGLPFMAGVVAQFEPEQLIAVARKLPGREDSPGFWAEAAHRIAVYQRDQLVPLLNALTALPVETRQEVIGSVREALKVDDKTAAAFAAAEAIAAPREKGPTIADCERALGL